MTYLVEVAMITFSCVSANHLGLVDAVERTIRHKLPIINCSKCLTWWSLMIHGLFAHENLFVFCALAFLCSYLATWLHLLMAYIDTFYDRIYEQICTTASSSSIDETDTDRTVSDV